MQMGQGRSLAEIRSLLHKSWALELDAPRSAAFAHEARLAVLKDFDPVRDYYSVAAAAQFLWETEDDLLNASILVHNWRRRVHQLTESWTAQAALDPRFRALVLHGRLAHRAQQYARPRAWNDAALRQLRLNVGGDTAHRAIIKDEQPTFAGQLYAAFLAIQLPVIRLDRANWP